MPFPILSSSHPVSALLPVTWAERSWQRARAVARAALAEAVLYASGSWRSRLRGRTALRELDARLRRDIGLAGNGPDGRPANFDGLR